jgi:hypothetical protein
MSHEEMDSILGVPDDLAPVADEISFDLPETIDREFEDRRSFNTPAVGGRFNVLRPPQQRPAYEPPPPRVQSPQAGPMREVARVGRFAVLTPEEETPRDYVAEARARLEDRAMQAVAARPTARELNERQREHRAAVHEQLPTSYDRLLGDDPYEDDLE